ncbi:hypothetical protein [Bradyrhizobium sp. CCBAU 53421]|nr:hypothetical protein [Bradyrhizobium sp. CCBAU 53421]
MNISDYDVTELTFEEACAAAGGQDGPVCVWDPEEENWYCVPDSF